MMNEKTKDYLNKYKKENCLQICVCLSKKHDADIIEYLSKQKSKQGTIKKLIRERIEYKEG